MLTDNFPFKAYSTNNENVFINESADLSRQSIAVLNRISEKELISKEAIIFALISIYLHKYMEDNIVSTICLTPDKTMLLPLSVNDSDKVSLIAKQCDDLMNSVGEHFIDEGFVIINVASDLRHTVQELPSQYQVLLDILLDIDKPSIKLSYRKNTLLGGAAELIVHQLSHFIGDVEAIWHSDIASVSLMTNAIKDKILNEFRVHHKTFNYRYGIYQRFLDQAKTNADNIAVVFAEKEITYQQLSESVDKLAATMYQLDVRKGQRVGVFLHRSEWSLISILAILKLGCSYIPLDCSYPEKYIDNIQKETGFGLVLSETILIDSIKTIDCQVVDVLTPSKYKQASQSLPSVSPEPHDEFAILYTSGTTGRPKGAIYNHASPINKFSWMWDFFNFSNDDVFLQRTSVNFSPSLWEFFGALLIGLKTVIVPDSVVKDPIRLMNAIVKEKVTFMGVVPALLRMLFEGDKQLFTQSNQLRYISCSGEPMQIDLYQKIKNIIPDVRIFNDYGSTEMNAVGYSEITEESTQSKNFPIGKPISNVYYYILDNELQLVPPFMAGNLYVGGVSLLNGYVGDVEPPFINDPILNTGARFFKSGDKARFLADGKIELVGRDDFIVKVRGMRVSLYQVETVIKACKTVADACVVSRKKSNGENEIVAYLSSDESVLAIRNYCMSVLPEYMVPSKLVAYGVLPKKTNGKLDRKYLTDLAAINEQEKIAEITNPEDIKLTIFELVRAVFAGSHADYDCPFSLLGMTSVDAVALTAEVNSIWSLSLSVTALLQFDTINRLCEYIESIIRGAPIQLAEQEDLEEEVGAYSRRYLLPNTDLYTSTKNILVTGANGFLGTCVVASILENTDSDVFCVVRASSQTQAEQRIKRSLFQYGINFEKSQRRITVVCAEISEDCWGMAEEEYVRLAERVDGVFHLAANTNHFSDYLSLKQANVIATKNIIDFCFLKKAKSIIFSSSISVLLKHSAGQYYVDQSEGLVSPEGLYNGYGKTKWVSENILANARQCGLNVGVVRLGELSFHSQKGIYREDDIFHNCLKLISNMDTEPEWQDGYINCLAVDKVAKALLNIFHRIHRPETIQHFVFNLVSSQSIEINSIFSGKNKLPFDEWLTACKDHIKVNEQRYPPAFTSFFDNEHRALIKEYFKEISLDMDAYDDLLEGDYLKGLSVSKQVLQDFCGNKE